MIDENKAAAAVRYLLRLKDEHIENLTQYCLEMMGYNTEMTDDAKEQVRHYLDCMIEIDGLTKKAE